MIGIKVRTAFNEQAILVPVGLMKKSVLRRFGAYVMTTARRSIKRAPKKDAATGKLLGRGRRKKGVVAVDATAAPDDPPYRHGAGTWPKLIQFAVEEDGSGVVIGLVKTTGGRTGAMPLLTEHGGDATFRRAADKKQTRAHFRPHPVMHPAMEKELAKVEKLLEKSV